ncbi:hypothetical protein [Jannaschia sp. AI_61]|nr:hypothetical protein [Jannaschia sp. AI_61]
MRSVLFALTLCAAPVSAACPPTPDITGAVDALLQRVQSVETEAEARQISALLWAEWTRAPDETAQALLDDGMARRAAFDLVGAVNAFDALIDYCPTYAEGYNQRAFANFLAARYEAALPDLDRAIALNPRHVAAISGKGLTLISMGRVAEGQAVIRQALALNPWLSERRFLDLPVAPDQGGVEL